MNSNSGSSRSQKSSGKSNAPIAIPGHARNPPSQLHAAAGSTRQPMDILMSASAPSAISMQRGFFPPSAATGQQRSADIQQVYGFPQQTQQPSGQPYHRPIAPNPLAMQPQRTINPQILQQQQPPQQRTSPFINPDSILSDALFPLTMDADMTGSDQLQFEEMLLQRRDNMQDYDSPIHIPDSQLQIPSPFLNEDAMNELEDDDDDLFSASLPESAHGVSYISNAAVASGSGSAPTSGNGAIFAIPAGMGSKTRSTSSAEAVSYSPSVDIHGSSESIALSSLSNPNLRNMDDDPSNAGADLGKHAILMERQRKRRESHNAVERRRRDHINDRIQELAILVPDCESSKSNKGIILRKTTDYVRFLQNTNKSLMAHVQMLQEEVAALKHKYGDETDTVKRESP
eukprot:Partr_v1_DN28087_c1_g1_i3_m57484 putative transcription factor